ncbi:unnamed protein product [Gordionus sp. m RMFG-2023]
MENEHGGNKCWTSHVMISQTYVRSCEIHSQSVPLMIDRKQSNTFGAMIFQDHHKKNCPLRRRLSIVSSLLKITK